MYNSEMNFLWGLRLDSEEFKCEGFTPRNFESTLFKLYMIFQEYNSHQFHMIPRLSFCIGDMRIILKLLGRSGMKFQVSVK